ncbi:zinc finger, CCHC-type containing protein [Tanacetum coccineum]|uniref:Zinc finger, CCHC-type containing protein n=1 Tax=Tanacetum coccineum TaxID=301880 RepID=A0ABQ5GZQ1_9ASTR
MGDANPIRTHSKPSHKGYRNTIELHVGNNVVPLRSDTISMDSFQGLTIKSPLSWHRSLASNPDFFYHVSFHLKCEIKRATGRKIRNKNPDESWEIIENLALYDHGGWNDAKEFVKPVKAISTPQPTLKTPDRRILELGDYINFLLNGSRPTPRLSSTHVPQAYAEAVYSNPHPRNQNEPPKQSPFTFHECTSANPQPQVLGTTFEARVRDYMAAHTKRFENAIFKQKEEESNDKDGIAANGDINETNTEMPVKEADKENKVEGYYLKHTINEKLIKGLVDNNRFNDSLSRVRVGKVKGKTYNVLPKGPIYEAILIKKITRKEDIEGNFKIPCNIRRLKNMNALVDQGFDMNVMPVSTYMKLTDQRPAKMDIRLSLASHSYIYPLGIAEYVLVEVAKHVYPVDFVILDIKENEKRPFILGTSFLTTAKAVIKFDKGTITLRSGKSKISFHRIPESIRKDEKGIKNDIEPIAPTMTVNRLVLEWEEKIKLHQEKEMEFDRWRNKNVKNERPAPVKIKDGMDDDGEVK